MDLLKCHSSSNDFFIVNEAIDAVDESHRSRLVRALCDRSGILGADGVLFVQRDPDGLFRMRIINADGGEAEMCGNGIRCVGRYLLEAAATERIPIRTMKETIEVTAEPELAPGVTTIGYSSRAISFANRAMPIAQSSPTAIDVPIPSVSPDRTFTAVSMPNPHIVAFVDEIDLGELARAGGAAARAHNLFPNGVNVSFAKVLGPRAIYVATFERGVGLTSACGTAMSGACVVGVVLSIIETGVPADVFTDGGVTRCSVTRNNSGFAVQLQGNATYTYRTSLDPCLLLRGSVNELDITAFYDEIGAYECFLDTVRARLSEARRSL
jgi:diaminopimelate epimerase